MTRILRAPVVLLVGALVATAVVAPQEPAAAADARPRLVLLAESAPPAATAQAQARSKRFSVTTVYPEVGAYLAVLSDAQAAALESDAAVASVEPVTTWRRAPEPRAPRPASCRDDGGPVGGSAPQVCPSWVDRVDAERSSTASGNGRGAVDADVAVLDDGVDGTHEDLTVTSGVDCTSGRPVVQPVALAYDTHGTQVAGVVAAQDDGDGVVGIAPGARIRSVAVFDPAGNASDATVVCGLDWVTSTRTDRDRTNDVDVANLSLGTLPEDGAGDDGACGRRDGDVMHRAVCRATRAGVLVVASAGNDGADLAQVAPAAYDEVLTVTAFADYDGRPGGVARPQCGTSDDGVFGLADDRPAFFSNYTTSVAELKHVLAAPGVCMTTTSPRDQYSVVDGTSFSAPVVAGAAALCIATRRCPEGRADVTRAKLVADAALANAARPRFGVVGDPLRPVPGKKYGFAVDVSRY